ncbi:nocturnin isoform X2 [Hetaerina americana]|uniref:nocturnin isoform X2 n=1 Tax=Hetaerina americana TaxID=62018 RepID=UPI003A7F49CB
MSLSSAGALRRAAAGGVTRGPRAPATLRPPKAPAPLLPTRPPSHGMLRAATCASNHQRRFYRLERMGSFTSAPKVPKEDAADPDVSIPSKMTRDALLERCRWEHSRLPALIRRNFRCISPSKESEENGEDWTLSSGVRVVGWNLLSRVCSSTSSPNHLRVLQWNVLSQALGQENDNFMCCPEEALDWQTRRFQMLEEILEYNPDVICLQEVDHFGFLYRALSSVGYSGTFFPKPDSPCLYVSGNNGPDGCAIFFRTNKFTLISVDTRVLEVWRVQSNQVAIITRLAIRETGQQLLVCTTHLKARKGALLSTLRNEQGRDLLDFVAKHTASTEAETGKRPPVLMCGDFNAEPIEPVYSSILSDERLSLSSAYAQYPVTPSAANMVNGNAENLPDGKGGRLTPLESGLREPPYTTWKVRESEGEVCHTIDYIFHSQDSLAVEALLEFPTGEDIGPGRVPSLSYPSDHFSLVCDFHILDASGNGVVSQK